MEDGAQKFTRRPKALLNDLITHQVGQVEPGVPQLNTNVEVRSQLFQSFIDRYLPQSQYIRDRTGENILQTLPDLSGSSLLLDKAVVALPTAFLAKQNQDRHLLQNSTKIYGNAIQMLYGKISSGRALGKDALYTTIIFQIYEVCLTDILALGPTVIAPADREAVNQLLPTGIWGVDCPCPRQ